MYKRQAVEAANELLNLPVLPDSGKIVPIRHTDIALQGVSFSYDGTGQNEVLHDISLKMPQGSFTALVGPCLFYTSLHDVFTELYRRGVRRFYVGGALGVDLWAGEILLEMRRQEEYQELEIVLVYPFPGHDERWDPKSQERLRHLKENCDQFVMGSKIVGAQGYRERTAYMVEHADCLVAVCDDETAGPSGVEAVLRMAKVQKIVVVQICPKTGRIVWK